MHEAERRVPRFELLRALEEADDLAILGIRGHPVPEPRREGWRAGFDDRMEPLAHGAIRFRHLGDLREHGAFPVRLVLARTAWGRIYELTGPRSQGMDGVAREYSDALNREVTYCDISPEDWERELKRAGLPDHLTRHQETMAKFNRAVR